MRDIVAGQKLAPAAECYGAGAIAFHWTVAALIVFLGALGLLFDDIPKEARPFWINVHGSVGLVYFALVIARLGWRATHKAPDLPPDIGEFIRRRTFISGWPMRCSRSPACTRRPRFGTIMSGATGCSCA